MSRVFIDVVARGGRAASRTQRSGWAVHRSERCIASWPASRRAGGLLRPLPARAHAVGVREPRESCNTA